MSITEQVAAGPRGTDPELVQLGHEQQPIKSIRARRAPAIQRWAGAVRRLELNK